MHISVNLFQFYFCAWRITCGVFSKYFIPLPVLNTLRTSALDIKICFENKLYL